MVMKYALCRQLQHVPHHAIQWSGCSVVVTPCMVYFKSSIPEAGNAMGMASKDIVATWI